MKKQHGSILLEVALVLAVSTLLVVITIRYFTIVERNTKLAQAISRIDIISRASYQWMVAAHRRNFVGIEMPDLIKSQLISLNDVKNPWGLANISVKPGRDNKHIQITLAHVTMANCESIRRHLEIMAYVQVSQAECQQGKYFGEF